VEAELNDQRWAAIFWERPGQARGLMEKRRVEVETTRGSAAPGELLDGNGGNAMGRSRLKFE